jgi:hypothetical protein
MDFVRAWVAGVQEGSPVANNEYAAESLAHRQLTQLPRHTLERIGEMCEGSSSAARSPHMYAKRPRRKTRPDKYEPNHTVQRVQRPNHKRGAKFRHGKNRNLRTSEEVMNTFESDAVGPAPVIVKSSTAWNWPTKLTRDADKTQSHHWALLKRPVPGLETR